MPSVTRGFAWAKRTLRSDEELSSVTRQGVWVLAGLIGVSILGFGFWALAARGLYSTESVGIAASLVSLSSFGASLAILGFDAGLIRFAPQVLHPRKLIWTILGVTGLLAAGVGLVLPLVVLTLNRVEPAEFLPLVGLSLALTVWTVWSFVTNGALIAARKAQVASSQLLVYGVLKIALLLVFVAAGVVGIFAAYTLPLLVLILIGFLLIPRYYPAENPQGRDSSLREVASLSAGNWISGFGYSVPNLSGPALILTFFGASTAAYFFLAFQLAEILNYGAEALSKSLSAHGSRQDRLARSLTTRVRWRVFLILLPLVAGGILAAPLIASLVGGPGMAGHALLLQLFLLATLPRSSYQVLLAQFNVDRRPRALAICGATFGLLTLAGFLLGLLLRVGPDVLPTAWIVGGVGALLVGEYFAGRGPAMPVAETPLSP